MTPESAALLIVEQIYLSSVIPEEQKEKFVEHIEKNGFSEELITKLEELFNEEAKQLEGEISDSKSLIKDIEQMIAEEDAKNDRPQAEILMAVHQRAEKDVQELAKEIENVEKDSEKAAESVSVESESSEIDKIRAELLNKNK
jgi:hypothetical protein